MKKLFFVIVACLSLISCSIKSVEPGDFEGYLLNGGAKKVYKPSEFLGNYKIEGAWFEDFNNLEINSHSTILSLKSEADSYLLEIPIFNINNDSKFFIRWKKFKLENNKFVLTPSSWTYNDNIRKVAVEGTGTFNTETREINVQLKYYYIPATTNSLEGIKPEWTKNFKYYYVSE